MNGLEGYSCAKNTTMKFMSILRNFTPWSLHWLERIRKTTYLCILNNVFMIWHLIWSVLQPINAKINGYKIWELKLHDNWNEKRGFLIPYLSMIMFENVKVLSTLIYISSIYITVFSSLKYQPVITVYLIINP